jgi:sulfur-oxidizing protein SoxZ
VTAGGAYLHVIDQVTAPIPRDIINLFVCTYKGTEIFRADLHQAIAANPFITFFTADDNGQVETASAKITVE